MAHKVRVDVSFADLDQYQTMKNQLDQAGIHFDGFVTYCVDTVWNQMLQEYKRQLVQEAEDKQLEAEVKEELAGEISGDESEGDIGQIPNAEGLDIEEPSDGPADNAAQG